MQIKLVQKATSWTIFKLLDWLTYYLGSINIELPRLEAEIIVSHVLKVERLELYLKFSSILSYENLKECEKLVLRRSRFEPISYILGYKEFWSMDFKVDSNVLIPRPETESLVSSVLPFLMTNSNIPMKILDMGTGSGAIIVALASEVPFHQFYALDISYEAIHIAKGNAIKNNLSNDVFFFVSSWLDALKLGVASFDLIISNPPYIKSSDLKHLQPEIASHEPTIALNGGIDGLECFRVIIKNSMFYLRSGGLLALEIGWDQLEGIKRIIKLCDGYSDVQVILDNSGLNRVLHLIRS